ncbi:MAG: 8-amino-7-oxononanoate synthase [Gammaproteobacteria bacterium]|nr:8-amino-7-oxononanoate synthase [Gammaproteobacteria bacterium]
MKQALAPALAARQEQQLYRRRKLIDSPQSPHVVVDSRSLLNFCSNDYLGLANHPEIKKAFSDGVRRWGVGSGSAHLVSGHSTAHEALEQELAAFTGRARALLFSSGYMANLGLISALLGRGDAAFEDRLNHASLLDGGLLSGARLMRYPHNDVAALEKKLLARPQGRRLVLTDGVFSMDGDQASLKLLAEVCQQQEAWLMVDDAHGFGVLGETGGGSLQQAGLDEQQVPVLMATLGKAVGCFGAFVAGSEELIETLIQQARSYIYTTATPPALAEATRVSLRLLQQEGWRREKLAELIAHFRTGAQRLDLPLMNSTTPIQPLLIGSSERAMQISSELEKLGFLVTAIRPPTVPEGSARLRVTLSAEHTFKQVDLLLAGLAKLKLLLP